MVLQQMTADDHVSKARSFYNDSYNPKNGVGPSEEEQAVLLQEATFHATMAVFEELRQMRRENGDATDHH